MAIARRRTRAGRAGLAAGIAVAIVAAAVAYVWRDRALPESQDAGAQISPERPAISLPDLARLDEPVRERVRNAHAAFTRALERGAPPSERAEAAGAYGQLLLATEYLAEAEAAFLEAGTLVPSDMRWPYYLGHVYRLRQQPARAISSFERVLALAPDHVASLIWLGDLHLTTGNAAAAEPFLQRALALEPDSAAAASRLGRAALARGDYARAIDHLERALRLQPDASSVHYTLGMAYRGAGDLARAGAHLQQAGDSGDIPPIDPLMDAVAGLLQNAGAYEARGMEALDAGDYAAAVQHLRQAVALAPANAIARSNLGMALSLSGDPDAARRQLLEAVRLDPTLAKAHFGLGVLAREQGRWDEAVERLSTALRHEPGFVDAHFTLAETLRYTGDLERSLQHYAHVLRLNSAASQARFGYAMALVRLGRFTAARGWLDEATALHPEQPGFPHALARVLAAAPDPEARDGQRALELMQKLIDVYGPTPAALETLAMAFAENGRFSEAAEWQRRAIAAAAQAGNAALAAEMRDNLGRYERGEPCRTPWRPDDPALTGGPS